MLKALLDTNICIYIAKHHPVSVAERFAAASPGSVGVSIITWGELCFGASKSQHPAQAQALLDRFASSVPVQALAEDVGRHYGAIRNTLQRAGTSIGNNDLWIAAHALALNVTLVTNNMREFERVPGLRLENWV